ncbi:MAG TPA: hypothetical protein VMD03_09315 [Steroidobacteraceae bacterium]|nr:hypothetical protein [Steroidobacteraceae bacterium]
MTCSAMIVACSCVLTLAVGSLAAHATAPSPAEPATWITNDIEINLQNLPKLYTCDDLWYKVHGVLLAIGARKYMAITPYNCGARAPGGGRSPTVDVRFQTLRVLRGAEIRWAQTNAIERTVRLAPGEPNKLDASDCALLSQLNATLFPYLGIHIVAASLECSSPQAARKFSVAVDTLLPVPITAPGAHRRT